MREMKAILTVHGGVFTSSFGHTVERRRERKEKKQPMIVRGGGGYVTINKE